MSGKVGLKLDYVEPIRDRRKIAQIKNILRGQNRHRDLLLFTIGINSALRVSDLLRLQVHHVLDSGGIVGSFTIRELKTGKRHEVTINDSIRSALREYLGYYPGIAETPTNFLFFSLKPFDYHRPIDRRHAWVIISTICHEVGLPGNYGAHTLRKTWGYHARMNGVDLVLIMQKLNHSSLAVTKRYLGITDDELSEVVRGLNL
jgi:integrase